MPTLPYCTKADLLLPSEALAELQDADIAKAIASATSEANAYLASQYTLPLIPNTDPDSGLPVWPAALTNAVAQIATYRALILRGYAPQAGQNDTFRDGYKDAVTLLKAVSKSDATFQVRDSNTGAQTEEGGGPSSSAFVTQPSGGFGGTFSESEDAWHDRPSAGSSGAFSGSRSRGY
jgi:phage gp36-like protein